MRLDDEDSGDGLKLVSGSYGMDVPSACTIVIIAGNLISLKLQHSEWTASLCRQPVQLVKILVTK